MIVATTIDNYYATINADYHHNLPANINYIDPYHDVSLHALHQNYEST